MQATLAYDVTDRKYVPTSASSQAPPRIISDTNHTAWRFRTRHRTVPWLTMPIPRSLRPLSLVNRTYRRAAAPCTSCRSYSTSTPNTSHGVASRIELRRPSSSARPACNRHTVVQRRNMSSPKDHEPLKNPPKTPPIPKPSSRYSHHKSPCFLHTNTAQCPLDIAIESNSPSPPRPNKLLLRLGTRLPWWRIITGTRWRDTWCR